MTLEEKTKWVTSRKWYHRIDLGWITTPGEPYEHLWNLIREVRGRLDYKDKLVLDTATYDGMWAFEAEKLGARQVIATDCHDLVTLEKFLFCRTELECRALPFFNINAYNLFDRLDWFFEMAGQKFDIVHHTGLLYHLRDPLMSLSQARSCLKPGGKLLLETAFNTSQDSIMVFNGPSHRVYRDGTTWWAPSLPCLYEMLRLSYLEPDLNPVSFMESMDRGRICFTATAVEHVTGNYEWYLMRLSMNPGLDIRHKLKLGQASIREGI